MIKIIWAVNYKENEYSFTKTRWFDNREDAWTFSKEKGYAHPRSHNFTEEKANIILRRQKEEENYGNIKLHNHN